MKTLYIVYHSVDMDGWLSAYLVYKKFKDSKDYKVVFIPYNYGDKNPTFTPNSKIVCVDVTLQPLDIYKQLTKDHEVTMIDHHQTSKEFFEDENGEVKPEFKFKGYKIEMDKHASSCMLTQKYFFPDEKVPKLVQIASDYDAWNDDDKSYLNNVVLPYMYYFISLNLNPINDGAVDRMTQLFKDIVDPMQSTEFAAKSIKRYVFETNKANLLECSYVVEHKGYKILCLNTQSKGSSTFDALYNPNKHDVLCVYKQVKSDDGYEYKLTMYTKKDINIPEVFDGFKGHARAAGFISKSLPWDN